MEGATEQESVVIVGYDDRYCEAFDRLNRAWLEGYGLLEESDLPYLENPRASIIDTGGAVFIALAGETVVGTCAAVVRDKGRVELAKLAVSPEARGRGLGRLLSEAAVGWARRQGARRVVLVSSTKLQTALKLYERMGFRHGSVPADTCYKTADVYMELEL